MVEIAAWVVAAIFFAVICVLAWFFLKLFFRLAILVIAISFFIAFLYHFSLLPETWAKQVDALILKSQELIKVRSEKKLRKKKILAEELALQPIR